MISRFTQKRFVSQLALTPVKSGLFWQAHENDPLKHNKNHLGLFYDIPSDRMVSIYADAKPMNTNLNQLHHVLGRASIMIRKPALDIINYLKCLDYSKPATRFLLYGEYGAGKTMTLYHLQHYMHSLGDHFLIYVPKPVEWTKFPSDQAESLSRPGRLDLPIDSAYYLQKFKIINSDLLQRYGNEITCSRDYNWSSREITRQGEPITNVIEHGINRVNHASDCLAVLLKELKLSANEGVIKMSVLVDKVNLFYPEEPKLKHNDRKVAYPDDVTPTRAFKKLFKNDWNGGVVIAVVDKKFIDKSIYVQPRKLLTIEGWNTFEPCLPIEVTRYDRKEFETCMNYYQDIKWLQRSQALTEEGRDEIRFVSALNPCEVFRISKYL